MRRVFWRNGSWCMEAETEEEAKALRVVFENSKFAPPAWEVDAYSSEEGVSVLSQGADEGIGFRGSSLLHPERRYSDQTVSG